jgi:hypothetical protein
MGKILTILKIEKQNCDGVTIYKHETPSRSWLLHFMDLWYQMLGYGVNTLPAIKDISGTNRVLPANSEGWLNLSVGSPPGGIMVMNGYRVGGSFVGQLPMNTLITGEYLGIVVGSGNTVVTPLDNSLVTKINHGAGAGLLEYGGCEVLAPVAADPNATMLIRRYFTNHSGGNITIEEAGIYSQGSTSTTNAYTYCICRDVVSPAVVVADTEILRVTYTVQITV